METHTHFEQAVEIIKQAARNGETPDDFAHRAAAQAKTEMADEAMRATYAKHVPGVVAAGQWFVPSCSCGWVGMERRHQSQVSAEVEADHHAKAASR